MGRFFTSKYIFSKYRPNTPKEKRINPPRTRMMHISEGHPATGSPKQSALIKTIIRKIKATMDKITPKNEIHVRGQVVYAIIACNEYLNS